MDFTRTKYSQLIAQLQASGYSFITFADYCAGSRPERYVILRHDVDLKPQRSLDIAQDEHRQGATASYYFRAVAESWDETVIKAIAQMGFEVGYHYESLTTCNGDIDAAYHDFCTHLQRLRMLTDVRTICMHGSPKSSYDSKDIWQKYDFKQLGIVGEPYLTADFSDLFYLTDTGRRWDGYKVSVRDKIKGHQESWDAQGLTFHTTDDIIQALRKRRLPNHIMITTHPQRWMQVGVGWTKELILQNIKNIIKKIIIINSNN